MDKETGTSKAGSELPATLEFENAADATCFWFAAAVLFAVVAGGLIVYRTGDTGTRMASNDIISAAPTNLTAPATLAH